jgi:hypothetical protein
MSIEIASAIAFDFVEATSTTQPSRFVKVLYIHLSLPTKYFCKCIAINRFILLYWHKTDAICGKF